MECITVERKNQTIKLPCRNPFDLQVREHRDNCLFVFVNTGLVFRCHESIVLKVESVIADWVAMGSYWATDNELVLIMMPLNPSIPIPLVIDQVIAKAWIVDETLSCVRFMEVNESGNRIIRGDAKPIMPESVTNTSHIG